MTNKSLQNIFTPLALLQCLLLLVALVSFAPVYSTECPPPQTKQAVGFYRAQLGAFEITVLADGTGMRKISQMLSDPEKAQSELTADHETEPLAVSINAYLINTGSHLVLVDTGTGQSFGSGSGLLTSNLDAAGYHAEQIDTILLTHFHPDHVGGLSAGGKRQFPNATIYADAHEIAYWLSEEEKLKAPAASQKRFEQARQAIEPYKKENRVVETKPDSEIVPGITTVCAYGHTPGHTAYLVQSQEHKLLLWGDTIHCAEVQFAHPEITAQFDANPALAAQNQIKIESLD